ncbi:hypothetical protein [Methanoregula sp. PtaB.Bin085]|uniref:hypothetical protein n=1 Tax=Methanoregula sp. PtaB.Bin085 TaxID=1811680 RepID=UPI0009D38460|nr:hypothetical protein [Methanoregula sp. PtaB.Bin085]OPX64831.1 MAG: hypothetical protein A4E33_00569 [Methanoregula sp. PtaB.Bin085]
MVSAESEQCSSCSGCGRVDSGTSVDKPRPGFTALYGKQAGNLIHLHCTGCGRDVMEQDVFDITGYRSGGSGPDEVTFICPLCGAVSASMRLSRAGDAFQP